MTAHPSRTGGELARAIPEFRIVTGPICGGLLGPEWIVATCDKYFRVGALTVGQLKRGVPADELEMLEVNSETYEAL